MGISLGSASLTALRLGTVPLVAVRLGAVPVWTPNSLLRDDFNRPDGPLGADWAEISSTGQYKASVVDEACRIDIPDGILQGLGVPLQVSRFRYVKAQTPGDDGDLVVRLGSQGAPSNWLTPYYTQVFRRMSNTGFTHGVGLQFDSSTVNIIRKSNGTDALVLNCGAFQSGDTVRLTQAGNRHTCLVNGRFAGEWLDTGSTASSGANYRSVGIVVTGAKDVLGPRKFSPSLDYVEAT